MNKYIYIKETGQVAGPLTMDKPTIDTYQGGDWTRFNEHLKSLPRIDIVGEHSFTDGQILEEGKDIRRDQKWIGAELHPNQEYKDRYKTIAISLKQVQKEKDLEPEVHAINKASVEEAAISHLETLYIKDYVRQRLKEPDWPLGWDQILRAFEKGAEWAASQEVKGNATQQGFPEYLTTLAHQYATDSEWGYPDDKAGRWMFEVVKQVFKDGYCRALTDNSLLPEKPNSSTSPERSVAENVAQGTEPMANNNSFTEEDLLELNKQLRQENAELIEEIHHYSLNLKNAVDLGNHNLRKWNTLEQENKTLLQRIKALEEENRSLKESILQP